jgi:predicted metal-dependent enzyme (double-stranded beta helix superfamily)
MTAGGGTFIGMEKLANIIRTDLRPSREAGLTAERVSLLVQAYAPTPCLLSPQQRQGSPDRVASHLLHAEHDFSMVALVWRPGQRTRIHDHLCWCVVYVVQGTEQETRYRDDGDILVETERMQNPVGSVSALAPPGDIHSIRNDSDRTAISLHVYGIDLRVAGSSARRVYDLPVRIPQEAGK